MTLTEIQAESSAQKDELEESETRVEHLKMQLEGMARKAAQQENDMRALVDELTAEKKARAQEKLMRERGVPVVGSQHMASEGSTISEDLGVEDEQRHRKWRKSLKSDGSYDTDEESVEEESVFSRSRSPTIAPSVVEGSVIDAPASHKRVVALGQGEGRNKQPMNRFQKLVKAATSALKEEEEYNGPGCRNCKGQDASVAWNTVSLLRDENKHLKQRVGQLEVSVESALDAVNGFGFDVK